MLRLTERQEIILGIFLEQPEIHRTLSDFDTLSVDRTTLFRDLRKLVECGLLELEGKRYTIRKDSDAYLEWDLTRPPALRKTVHFNPGLLDDYTPNKSFFLSDEQLTRLAAVGAVPDTEDVVVHGKPYERILSSLLIDLSHASSTLENVKISWLDTKALIEFGERPDGLDDKQMRIVLNHKDAIAYLVEHGKDMALSRKDLLDLHAKLMAGLIADRGAIGALRARIVKFDDSRYIPPETPQQLNDYFNAFCEKGRLIENPYEQAFFAMAFIPYLQPFQDGNKRTSRLAMNIPLIRGRLPPFSFTDMRKRDYLFGLLAFYERGRHDFLARSFTDAYERSAARYTELVAFVNEGGALNTLEYKPPKG